MSKENMTREEILFRIGYFRNKKGLSAYKVGKQLGHSKNYFYRIERGEINLSVENLLDILDFLEVSTSEFFYPDLDSYKKDKEILNLTKDLTTEELESLRVILKRK